VRVEAVIADLDGTLVDDNFAVSAATLRALDTLRAAGLRVVVATARTPQGLRSLPALTARIDIAVCCSGAIGYSAAHRRIWQHDLAPGTVAEVVAAATPHGAGVAGFDGALWRETAAYEQLSAGEPHGPPHATVTAAALAGTRYATMAVRHADDDLAVVARALGGSVHAALSRVACATVLDITSPGVDKGSGARQALALLGVNPGAAIGFGDMPNDLPMFAVTARGYAVGNHHPAMRAADEILDPVERDGFARKISELAAAEWTVR
jgi:hydroxymethylpyrimidine pyrophosphatase-like HAD family hydrolase